MNIEVEIKISTPNLNATREIVRQKGSLVRAIRQIDEYYIPIQRDFFAQKPFPVEWLRIRHNPDKTIFEYDRSINKRKNGAQEYAEEYETEISNPDEFKKILGFLDFKHVITVDKQREYWLCGDLEIALDSVKDLGDFIEVEAKGNFESSSAAKTACLNFLSELGTSQFEEINKGYPVLLLEKRQK
ncbi:MAG: class IV adenylate cyclase [Patescibacteria group bacterium]|jgi:adenylate cyclase class IV